MEEALVLQPDNSLVCCGNWKRRLKDRASVLVRRTRHDGRTDGRMRALLPPQCLHSMLGKCLPRTAHPDTTLNEKNGRACKEQKLVRSGGRCGAVTRFLNNRMCSKKY